MTQFIVKINFLKLKYCLFRSLDFLSQFFLAFVWTVDVVVGVVDVISDVIDVVDVNNIVLYTAVVMNTIPSVHPLLMNTIYLSIPQFKGTWGPVFMKHTVFQGVISRRPATNRLSLSSSAFYTVWFNKRYRKVIKYVCIHIDLEGIFFAIRHTPKMYIWVGKNLISIKPACQ